LDAVKVQKALRACLQDDEDVSDVASDEDEELRRIKEIAEMKEVRRREQENLVSMARASKGTERLTTYDDVELVGEFGGGGEEDPGLAAGVISIRFVDSKRHEFVTDAVVGSSFDYPVSKFVEHAVGAGWIGGREDVDRFVFDDEVVRVGEDTPRGLDMEDGDTVDVVYAKK
jgi:hypothetical protein